MSADDDVLDHPTWASLTGAHAHLAELRGQAGRYQPDVAPFGAVDPALDPEAWDDLSALVGPGGSVALAGNIFQPSGAWTAAGQLEGVQMVGLGVTPNDDPDLIELGPADVPEMLALVARTKPGPFLTRTVEMGRYLGVRQEGHLIAMAGERLRPKGWTEISAVCTDDAFRGRGLASRLIRAVAAGIDRRGEVPFLHAAATNEGAIRLYETLGFTIRRAVTFQLFQAPGQPTARRRGSPTGSLALDPGVGAPD